MKNLPSRMLPITLLLLSSPLFADGFSVQPGKPTLATSLALQSYVKTISAFQPETAALNERLKKTLAYYSQVHILKTVTTRNYTVDCVPFAEQPALIDKPELAQSLLPAIIQSTQSNFEHLQKIGRFADFNAAEQCPLGSVAMLRPTKAMLTSRLANEKKAPSRNGLKDPLTFGGYTWEQGEKPDGSNIYIRTEANQAYFKAPQKQYVNPLYSGDHSLNQFWYTKDINRPHETLTYSVEFGIINSSYFTDTNIPSTAIFVFASIDNYGNKSCYDLECPNFIQAPNNLVLGAPVSTTADYVFRVTHATRAGFVPGYYLTLVVHDPANPRNNTNALLGFYPDALYTTEHRPTEFSAGAEVYAGEPFNGSLMAGNYVNPCAGYPGPKQIGMYSENGNVFPYTTSYVNPYGLIWNFGQS